MSEKNMDITIGRCGLACGVCKKYNNGCLGCIEQNEIENTCVIFNCAEEKSVKYCIQCQEYPCRLIHGLSKAYCPVFTRYKID